MKRVRLDTGSYKLMYEFSPGCFRAVARAAKTGTRRDNYPWEWYMDFGVELKQGKGQGTTESLKVAMDVVESRINQYGVVIVEMETVETDGDSTQSA